MGLTAKKNNKLEGKFGIVYLYYLFIYCLSSPKSTLLYPVYETRARHYKYFSFASGCYVQLVNTEMEGQCKVQQREELLTLILVYCSSCSYGSAARGMQET